MTSLTSDIFVIGMCSDSLGGRASKNDPSAATSSKNPQNMVRIPVIVADRLLQPFHTFELGGNVYPLTAERIE